MKRILIYLNRNLHVEWFYLNRETGTNLHCKIARAKQKKTIELVRNNA